jgi:hypothetical protein
MIPVFSRSQYAGRTNDKLAKKSAGKKMDESPGGSAYGTTENGTLIFANEH